MVKSKTWDGAGIWCSLILFVGMALLDLISTLRLGPVLVKLLESNFLFHLIGLPGIFVLNVGAASIIFWVYKNSVKPPIRYTLILCLVIISVLRIFFVYNNFMVAANPPTIEQAQSATIAIKNNYYFYSVFIPALVMYVAGYVGFLFFSMDHKIRRL